MPYSIARFLSVGLVVLLLQGCAVLFDGAGTRSGIYVDSQRPVPRFEIFEVTLHSGVTYENPYTTNAEVIFTAPDGRELKALAFHDGNNLWRARIAPDTPGTWRYRSVSGNATDTGLHGVAGQFECVSSKNRGFIKPDVTTKYSFSFSDGTPFYGVGDTSYALNSGISDSQMTSYLDRRRSQGFNFVRFFASANAFSRHKSLTLAESWPWGGTPESPDYDRLNPQYFRRLEATVQALKRRGMHAEILVFCYYWKPFTDPAVWTPQREKLWAQQVVARLAAHTTVFLWTVTNEYETYPEGKYRYDGASDDEWAIRIGTLLHELDPHRHPTTVHNFRGDVGGGTGDRFGNSAAIDVLSQQNWGEAKWTGDYMDGNAEGIESGIAADRKYMKPVVNTENGYEWLRNYTSFAKQGTGTDKARRAAWRTFVGGAAAYAAGFAGSWGGSDDYMWRNEGPIFFTLQGMGLGAQITHFRNFIDTVPFSQMAPAHQLVNAPNLCLANAGLDYVVYAPEGGEISIDLSSAPGRPFDARWLDPRTGKSITHSKVAGGAPVSFTSPKAGDWVLRLKAR